MFCLRVCLRTTCVPSEAREGIGSLGLELTLWATVMWVLGIKLGPLQEQPLLSTTEPSLQPKAHFLFPSFSPAVSGWAGICGVFCLCFQSAQIPSVDYNRQVPILLLPGAASPLNCWAPMLFSWAFSWFIFKIHSGLRSFSPTSQFRNAASLIVQGCLELTILLPPLPKSWGYKHAPPQSAHISRITSPRELDAPLPPQSLSAGHFTFSFRFLCVFTFGAKIRINDGPV